MEKELFIEVVDKMQELYDKECRITEFFQDEFSDSNGPFIYDEPLTILQTLLERLMNDQNDWISYYAWEQNFGREHKLGDVSTEDGTPIPLFNAEDLYNILTNE